MEATKVLRKRPKVPGANQAIRTVRLRKTRNTQLQSALSPCSVPLVDVYDLVNKKINEVDQRVADLHNQIQSIDNILLKISPISSIMEPTPIANLKA